MAAASAAAKAKKSLVKGWSQEAKLSSIEDYFENNANKADLQHGRVCIGRTSDACAAAQMFNSHINGLTGNRVRRLLLVPLSLMQTSGSIPMFVYTRSLTVQKISYPVVFSSIIKDENDLANQTWIDESNILQIIASGCRVLFWAFLKGDFPSKVVDVKIDDKITVKFQIIPYSTAKKDAWTFKKDLKVDLTASYAIETNMFVSSLAPEWTCAKFMCYMSSLMMKVWFETDAVEQDDRKCYAIISASIQALELLSVPATEKDQMMKWHDMVVAEFSALTGVKLKISINPVDASTGQHSVAVIRNAADEFICTAAFAVANAPPIVFDARKRLEIIKSKTTPGTPITSPGGPFTTPSADPPRRSPARTPLSRRPAPSDDDDDEDKIASLNTEIASLKLRLTGHVDAMDKLTNESDRQIKELEDKLRVANELASKTRAEKTAMEGERDDAQTQLAGEKVNLAKLDAEIKTLKLAQTDLSTKLKDLEDDNKVLNEEKNQLTTELATEKAQVAAMKSLAASGAAAPDPGAAKALKESQEALAKATREHVQQLKDVNDELDQKKLN